METSSKDNSFGVVLKQALHQRKMRQTQLAREVNCTPQYVSQLVTGERPASPEIRQRIAQVLNLHLDDVGVSQQTLKHRLTEFEMMPGIETGYLGAVMSALGAARTALLAQGPHASLGQGAGKSDAKLFDSVAEHAIAARLQDFSSRCAIITEEAGVIGDPARAGDLSYVVDPFDRSKPFFREVKTLFDPKKHRTLADLVKEPEFQMTELEAPMGSITCICDGEIACTAMIDYASGRIYVACRGFVGYGDIGTCPDPYALVKGGTDLTFAPKTGSKYLCFIGDQDKDQDPTVNEHSSKYRAILTGLGFDINSHLGFPNPGGPARILYLSDLYEDSENPAFIVSNGEKVFEFLGWLAFAIHSRGLAVYEAYSAGFEARGLILQAPPPNYSAFSSLPDHSGFRLNMNRIIDLDPPGHYRGGIVVTHAHSTVASAPMGAKKNSRRLYQPCL